MTCQMAIHAAPKANLALEAELMSVLLEAKVDFTAPVVLPEGWPHAEYRGLLLLDWLFATGREDLVKRYLELGAPVDQRDDQGRTLLVFAVSYSAYAGVRLLLEAGADPNVNDEEGRDVLASSVTFPHSRLFPMNARKRAVLDAVREPALATPTERVAAFDVVDRREREREDGELRAKNEEYTRRVAREREEAQREAARAAERRAAAEKASERPKAPSMGGFCDRPDIRACRETGKTCGYCFDTIVLHVGDGPSPLRTPTKSCKLNETACGAGCCGSGEVCCFPESGSPSSGFCSAVRTGRGCPWGYRR